MAHCHLASPPTTNALLRPNCQFIQAWLPRQCVAPSRQSHPTTFLCIFSDSEDRTEGNEIQYRLFNSREMSTPVRIKRSRSSSLCHSAPPVDTSPSRRLRGILLQRSSRTKKTSLPCLCRRTASSSFFSLAGHTVRASHVRRHVLPQALGVPVLPSGSSDAPAPNSERRTSICGCPAHVGNRTPRK